MISGRSVLTGETETEFTCNEVVKTTDALHLTQDKDFLFTLKPRLSSFDWTRAFPDMRYWG